MAGENTFTVEVLTPEGELFRGEATRLSTKTVQGEIGILANHVPILARLTPARLRVALPEGENREWAQGHGMVQVFGNHAQVLVEEAAETDSLDRSALEDERRDAEARLKDPESGEAERLVAERDLERIEAFLKIAG